MYDPKLMQDLAKIRQQELIDLGQRTSRARLAQPRERRTPMALLLLLTRTLNR
ncbi:MAG: hypothetical protein K8J31_14905 [Anaerolineae bacterium]|nr:hypothetical protein [Anaerolineae bacterium]